MEGSEFHSDQAVKEFFDKKFAELESLINKLASSFGEFLNNEVWPLLNNIQGELKNMTIEATNLEAIVTKIAADETVAVEHLNEFKEHLEAALEAVAGNGPAETAVNAAIQKLTEVDTDLAAAVTADPVPTEPTPPATEPVTPPASEPTQAPTQEPVTPPDTPPAPTA